MARALRRTGLSPAAAGLLALVAVSAFFHWLAGRQLAGLWLMPDEAIYAERARTLWQTGTLPLLHGSSAGYGVVYPILAGLPLAIGKVGAGYAALKVVQAVLTSLVAVPVFVWARRLMPDRYAFVAAALAVASPLVLYSGMVMTEAVFYPLAVVIMLGIAQALERATFRSQALALALIALGVLTRVQAAILLPAFAAAIVLDAVFLRSLARLRAFWPVWLVTALGAAATVANPGIFGAYADAVNASYPVGAGLRLTYDHIAYTAFATAIVPFAAFVLLLVGALRGRETQPGARALVASTAGAVVLITAQVGFFSARFPPHVLLGRYLAAIPPLLFLLFALWLSRGLARSRAQTLVAFGVLAVVALPSWDVLTSPDALPDTFSLVLLERIHFLSTSNVVLVLALVGLGLFASGLRRSAAVLLPTLALALLVASSTVAADEISTKVRDAQRNIVGPVPDWVDRATHGAKTTYLYTNEAFWNVVWYESFWNEHIDHVLSVFPSSVAGPLPQSQFTPAPSGLLPTRNRYVVTSTRNTLFGRPVAHLDQTGLDVTGLTLWRTSGPARLATSSSGITPNGDILPIATYSVYDCRHGELELTLLPKLTKVVRILLNGRLVLQQNIAGLPSWHATIPVPPSSKPRICAFTIEGQTLLGSTVVDFVR